ncbi:MAG: hypothetical protein GY820_14700, partial [Gammaproteobacteria bacterium]|nr:hypothetical protein [Gammaproteobacteria bacterium]
YLYQHFCSNNHSIEDLRIQIIEVVDNNSELINREDFWIRVLNTAHPFGLNDSVKGYGSISSGLDPFCTRKHPYFSYVLPRIWRSHGKRKQPKRKGSTTLCRDIISSFNKAEFSVRHLYIRLRSLRKADLKLLYNYIITQSQINAWDPQFQAAILSYVASITKQHKTTNKMENYYLPCHFPNKSIEMTKFYTIFKDKSVQRLLPINHMVDKPKNVKVIYQYCPPISAKVFNHAKTLANVDIHVLSKNLHCCCTTSQFMNAQTGHVLTGNLNIVKNPLLRCLLAKGAKYRDPKPINWNKTNEAIAIALDKYIQYLARKYKKH